VKRVAGADHAEHVEGASGIASLIGTSVSSAAMIATRGPRPASNVARRISHRRRGLLFGPARVGPPVIEERHAAEDLAALDPADQDPMVAGLELLGGHALRVRDRALVEDRRAIGGG